MSADDMAVWITCVSGDASSPFTDAARSGVDEVIDDIVDTIVGQRGKPGFRYLDHFGKVVRG